MTSLCRIRLLDSAIRRALSASRVILLLALQYWKTEIYMSGA